MIVELTKAATGKNAMISTLSNKEIVLDLIYEEATRLNIKMRLDIQRLYKEMNKIKIGSTFIKFYFKNNTTITFSTQELKNAR